MSDLTTTTWSRYGKKRLYVRTTDGADAGYIDLLTGAVVANTEEYRLELAELSLQHAQRLASPEADAAGVVPNLPPPVVLPAVNNPGPVPLSADGFDLSSNVAGAAARARRNEVNAQAPILNLAARLFGIKTDERAWRVGAGGEEKVGQELAKLPVSWHVLHAVQVSANGADIDHVLIAPAGVLTLNTKRHPDAKVTVYERTIYVNGSKVPYLAKARAEGQRASRLLTGACGFAIEARTAIVFVDLADINEKGRPKDIIVTTRRRLIDLLLSLPRCLSDDHVEYIHSQARSSQIWLPANT